MKKRVLTAATAALIFALLGGAADAANPSKKAVHQPGDFDYYLLALSWSPFHCKQKGHLKEERDQCRSEKHYGFIVHGLWPQYENRGSRFPESCATPAPIPESVVRDAMEITPSRKLINHEWAKHGTCVAPGIQPGDYFALARQALGKVRIPERLTAPQSPIVTSLNDIEAFFAKDNPGFTDAIVAVQCSGKKGRYMKEVQICFDKQLNPRACAKDVDDRCPGGAIYFDPVP